MKKIFILLFIYLMTTSVSYSSGYKGSLPDIKGAFDYVRATPQTTKGIFNTLDDNEKPNYKKIPKENKAYIDIILKKDKTSPYLTDLNDVIAILEKMQKCINSNGSIQKFNAIASSIIDHADYMAEKYRDKPERFYISFAKLQTVAAQAREIATLRCESQVYIKYLLTQADGKVYSQDSINQQIQNFEIEVDNAIKIMKDSI